VNTSLLRTMEHTLDFIHRQFKIRSKKLCASMTGYATLVKQ